MLFRKAARTANPVQTTARGERRPIPPLLMGHREWGDPLRHGRTSVSAGRREICPPYTPSTGIPLPFRCFLTWPMESVRKWNTEAARRMSAPPSVTAW
jgi:hypothetical protein